MLRPLAVSVARCRARQMSTAPSVQTPLVQQYRATAEDRLLSHMEKVAGKAHREGKLESAQELYEHLISARRARHGDAHPLTVGALGSLARVATERGDLNAAETLAREALSASETTLGAMHPDSLRHQSTLAAVLTRCGKLEEAESSARFAVEAYHVMYGDDHPDLATAQGHLGQVLRARSKHSQESG